MTDFEHPQELLRQIKGLRQQVEHLESRLQKDGFDIEPLEALSFSEELHRVTLSSISDAVFIADDDGVFTYVCPNVDIIFGHSEESVWRLGNVQSILGDQLFQREELLAKGEIVNIEKTIRDSFGNDHDVLVNVKMVTIGKGSTLFTCRDVTARKRMERELQLLNEQLEKQVEEKTRLIRYEEERYRRIVEGLKDEYFFYATNPEGIITYASPSVEGILGYSPSYLVGRNWRDIVDLSNPANKRLIETERDRFAGKNVGIHSGEINHAHDGVRSIEFRDYAVLDQHQNVIASEGIARDISEKVKVLKQLNDARDSLENRVRERTAELEETTRKLKQSEERYRRVVEDQAEFIVRWRPDGTRTMANNAYCRYFNQSPSELEKTSFIPLIHEDDRDKVRQKIDSLTPEKPIELDEHRVIRPDGSIAWQQWSDHAFFDESGNAVEYQSVGRDITREKENEQEQRQSEMAKFKVDSLSNREREVMEMVVKGLANKAIARQLDLSIKTVEKHRSAMMKKLQIRTVPDLVRLALQAEAHSN